MNSIKYNIYIIIVLSGFFYLPLAGQEDQEFNSLFRQDIGGWIAADATYSIALPDGKTLWLFGDTFIGETEGSKIVAGSKFIRNSAVIQDDDQLNTLFNGTRENPDDFIKTSYPDSTWYWPEHGIVDKDTLRIFVSEFRYADNGSEGFNFEQIGNDIACFSFPELNFQYTISLNTFQSNHVIYGDRILQNDNYLYIYGRKEEPSINNIPFPHVARAEVDNLIQQNNWEYFNGSNWSTEPSRSAPINDFQVSQQYSVSQYRDKYILLTQDIWLSPDIYTFVSDSPTGPWKNKTKIYTCPETGGSTFTYNAYAHPQFNSNGEMLISYNVNGDFWSIFDNVELYRPRFIRIPYMNLSYDFWPNSNPDQETNSKFKILPNPVSEVLILQYKEEVETNLKYNILNISGSIIMEGRFTNSQNELKIPLSIPAGYYFLKINNMERMEILPFIKI